MATAIVSGRVNATVKERASAYIHAAGLTTGEVINELWVTIAATGKVPAFAAEENADTKDALECFFEFCDSLEPLPGTKGIPEMNNEQLRDYARSHLEEKYA